MNRRNLFGAVLLLALTNGVIAAPPATIKNTPPLLPLDEYNMFFYEIGGGSNYRITGGDETPTTIGFGDAVAGDENFRLVLSVLDEFDELNSIKGILKGIFSVDGFKKRLNTAVKDVVERIIGQVGGVLEYSLCRANPLSCQINENQTIRAEEKTRETKAYLDKMEEELSNTRSSLNGWLRAGKSGRLIFAINEVKKGTGTDDVTLEAVADKVKEYKGDEGLIWINGDMAGGTGQRPIRPIADTVRAGFNMLFGRDVDLSTKVTPGTNPDPILDYWDTPEEAAKWVTEVVGEYRPDLDGKITSTLAVTNAGAGGDDDGDGGKGGEDVTVDAEFLASDKATPAFGLAPKILKEKKLLVDAIKKLIAKDFPERKLTVEQLKELRETSGKSTNFVLTPKIIHTIKHSPIQQALILRISEEAAQSSMIRAALLAKRMLEAGRSEPYIGAYDIAKEEIDKKILALNKNIKNILFERKISRELVSDTFVDLMNRSNEVLLNHKGYTEQPRQPIFGEGGIKK